MSAPLLVASDLDGTLLRSDGTVSERTRRALADIEEAGIEVVFVTARPPRWMDEVAHLVGVHGIALCGNGAFVYDVRSRRVLADHGIDDDLVTTLVTELRDRVPEVRFAAERRTGAYAEPGFPEQPPPDARASEVAFGAIEDRDEIPIGKLLAIAPGLVPEQFLALVDSIVGERAHVAYSGARGLAEINALGVTKAAALAAWVDRLGATPSQVWAFGDMPNDLPMLRWAGRSIAVANAHPEVLAEVDQVCPANDADGVAQTLEALLAALPPR